VAEALSELRGPVGGNATLDVSPCKAIDSASRHTILLHNIHVKHHPEQPL
ncbi:Transcriptional regulatory protein, partial [Giardia duodenalis]